MSKPSILIVDDNHDFQWMFRSLLEAEYAITTVDTGFEAIDLLKHHVFTLIITDLQMPSMSGVELIECIKSNEKTANIPIIVSSSMDLERHDLKVAAVVSKFDLTKNLGATVRRVLHDYNYYGSS